MKVIDFGTNNDVGLHFDRRTLAKAEDPLWTIGLSFQSGSIVDALDA